jgi:hypothetical protein
MGTDATVSEVSSAVVVLASGNLPQDVKNFHPHGLEGPMNHPECAKGSQIRATLATACEFNDYVVNCVDYLLQAAGW